MLHVALVRRCLRGVVAAGCCATLLACSGGSGPSTTTSGSADAIARYGQAAPRDPAGFTYQPDVVVVDGGPEAVRSVSADGLVWTVDGKASGLDGLDVGEVMFLTSRAAGRVAAKEPAGDDVAITLAPVQLNEIIRDGHIKVDTTIDSEAVLLQEIPGLPGALGVPDETDVGDIDPSLRGGGGGNNSPRFAGVSLVRLAEPGKGGPQLPPQRSRRWS
jgi:hypothetical protein